MYDELCTFFVKFDFNVSSCVELKSVVNDVNDGKEIDSRPMVPPLRLASIADSPPTLSYREPTDDNRVVV